jgi:hypothetical protein
MFLPVAEEIDIGGQTVLYLFDVLDTKEYDDRMFIIGVD